MKKQLFFTNNQKGFFLPYVMFVTTIIFIIVLTSINLYSNELKITARLLEQTKIETLIQMGRATILQDLSISDHHEGKMYYQFPSGNVEVNYFPFDQEYVHIHISITTDKNTRYTVTNKLKIVTSEE